MFESVRLKTSPAIRELTMHHDNLTSRLIKEKNPEKRASLESHIDAIEAIISYMQVRG